MKAFHDPKDDPTAKEQFIRARVTEEAEMGKEIERLKGELAEARGGVALWKQQTADRQADMERVTIESDDWRAKAIEWAVTIRDLREELTRTQRSLNEVIDVARDINELAERLKTERDAYLELLIYRETDYRGAVLLAGERQARIENIRRCAGLGETATRVETG